MKFTAEALIALSLTTPSSNGFSSSNGVRRFSRKLSGWVSTSSSSTALKISGQGWENDDFLNSLGGSAEDRENANAKYMQQKKDLDSFREGQMNSDSNQDSPEGLREPAGQSARFRAMMQQSQQSQNDGASVNLNDMSWAEEGISVDSVGQTNTPVVEAPAPVPPQNVNFDQLAQSARDGNYNPEQSSISPPTSAPAQEARPNFDLLAAQARGGMAGPPIVQSSSGPPPPPRRRDQISNTADVYLEQLKADTKARKESFLLGDDEGYQSVWKTPKIKDLENALVENPFFESEKERQKKLQNMFEPTEEDLLVMAKQMEEEELRKGGSAVSYKEKLAAKKQAKAGNVSPIVAATPPTAPVEEAKEDPFIMKAPMEVQVQEKSPLAAQDTTATIAADEESSRRLIRTMMGLILKHRGGPGFGNGILKGIDVERYEKTLNEVTELLRAECGAAAEEVNQISTPAVPDSVPDVQEHQQLSVTAQIDSSGPESIPSTLDSSIECIEAVVKMYKEAPTEQRDELLFPLRDAFQGVVTKCDNLVQSNSVPPTSQELEKASDIMTRVIENAPASDNLSVSTPSELSFSSNLELFSKAKSVLSSLQGDGKYGLRHDCASSPEAKEAIELLTQVRIALMDELDS